MVTPNRFAITPSRLPQFFEQAADALVEAARGSRVGGQFLHDSPVSRNPAPPRRTLPAPSTMTNWRRGAASPVGDRSGLTNVPGGRGPRRGATLGGTRLRRSTDGGTNWRSVRRFKRFISRTVSTLARSRNLIETNPPSRSIDSTRKPVRSDTDPAEALQVEQRRRRAARSGRGPRQDLVQLRVVASRRRSADTRSAAGSCPGCSRPRCGCRPSG